jgi:hypothetical protein
VKLSRSSTTNLLSGLLLATLAGCASVGIPRPPSLDLPVPVTDLTATRKGNQVYLSWTVPTQNTDHESVRHAGVTRVCRNLDGPVADCAAPVQQLATLLPPIYSKRSKPATPTPKVRAAYTDELSQPLLSNNPASRIFYAVSALSEGGRSAGLSNSVDVPAALALPAPADFRAEVTTDGVVLTWTALPPVEETPQLRHLYRVLRLEQGAERDVTVGEIPLNTSPPRIVDHNFEWEKNYAYRLTVVTVVRPEGKPEAQFEGDDTQVVSVFTHDIFPPAVPSGLQAAFSGVGQQPFIDLIWAPDTDADLAGYNVYRREATGEAVRMNSDLVKSAAFRDMSVASGHTYSYSVSAVDVRGNESARSAEASEAVP